METSFLTADDSRVGGNDSGKVVFLSSLSLAHFRNYSAARIEVTPAPVVLTGHNGAGKTNILEAISLLTPGRGLRRARLSEMDCRKGPHPNPLPAGEGVQEPSLAGRGQGEGHFWTVAANIFGMQGESRIGTGRDPEALGEIDKRIIKIDGKLIRGQAELARHLAIIWLTPQMEQLFQEGASSARKFLDRLVFSFDAEHASRINEYEFAMRERNKLLQNDRADSAWLDALEQTMAETAAAIASARLHTVEHINQAVQRSPLSFPKAHIAITGIVEDWLGLGVAAVQAEEDFKSVLRGGRRVDAASGRTLSGTHRSEMRVTHTGKNMPAESCSTGEQKAMLLSIVLAQARAGAQWHGVVPVILLDEVVAHLDAGRRRELFDEIRQVGAQAWMTGTDAALFAGLEGAAQYFQVREGNIVAVV
jgi:DNA replication and repair protein RecF